MIQLTSSESARTASGENIKSLVLTAFKGTSRHLIGSIGYTSPNTEPLQWIPLNKEVLVPNLTVKAEDGLINNWFVAAKGWAPPHPTTIVLGKSARDNVVVLDENARVYGQIVLNGTGALVAFSETTRQPSSVNIATFGRDEIFFWGKGATSNGVNCDTANDYGGIIVGDDCMFARGIWIRTSDQHAVFDIASMQVLNESASVVIEPHVWVGQDVMIMKGARIGLGSVVAAKALVNKTTGRYSLIGGTPAKVIREGVSWDRSLKVSPETMARLREFERALDAASNDIQ